MQMSHGKVKQIEISDAGLNNQVDIDPTARIASGVRICLYGRNNHLVIGEGTVLGGGIIELRNHDSSIIVGADCTLNGGLRCRARNTRIRIGDQTTMMMGQITLHEPGMITLGDDCMLSGDITMDVSDMHSILDMASGERLNPPRDIMIGDHVWLAQGVRIMKGAHIGQHSIIGTRSTVLGRIPAHSLAIGTPARVVRSGVTWDRRRLPIDGGMDASQEDVVQ